MLSTTMDDRTARAALTRLFEPGDTVGLALVAEHGAYTALRIAIGAKPAYPFGNVTADELSQGLSRWNSSIPGLQPEKDLDEIARLGGGFLIPGDEHWPATLDDLDDTPVGLWYRGNIELGIPAQDKAVALIGSRDCTSYGASVTSDLAHGLAQRGITIIAGLAYGVEERAHAAALAGAKDGLPATIAVVANGLNRDYPAGNATTAEAIRAKGLILSEMPPGSAPTRQRFLARSRIIATLAGVTCVVEARSRSAALSTARLASTLGRGVAALPGSVHSANSWGAHSLIKDGTAALVTDIEDLVEMLAIDPNKRADAQEPVR
ncbi:DNA-processing protein DprA [Micrococcaceae bacterium Sec7.4]